MRGLYTLQFDFFDDLKGSSAYRFTMGPLSMTMETVLKGLMEMMTAALLYRAVIDSFCSRRPRVAIDLELPTPK